jgi:hypothetical protein
MFIMLATGSKVRGFKPGKEQWIFKGDKNSLHDFHLRGVKPVDPFRNILQNFKYHLKYARHTDKRKFSGHFSPSSSPLRYCVYLLLLE